MISRKKKTAKKKVKSKLKQIVIRNPHIDEEIPSYLRTMVSPRNHYDPPIVQLLKLLEKRSEKAAAHGASNTWFHYNGIIDNIETDRDDNQLDEDPSRAELLKYLRTKKDILEGVITDFVRLG